MPLWISPSINISSEDWPAKRRPDRHFDGNDCYDFAAYTDRRLNYLQRTDNVSDFDRAAIGSSKWFWWVGFCPGPRSIGYWSTLHLVWIKFYDISYCLILHVTFIDMCQTYRETFKWRCIDLVKCEHISECIQMINYLLVTKWLVAIRLKKDYNLKVAWELSPLHLWIKWHKCIYRIINMYAFAQASTSELLQAQFGTVNNVTQLCSG